MYYMLPGADEGRLRFGVRSLYVDGAGDVLGIVMPIRQWFCLQGSLVYRTFHSDRRLSSFAQNRKGGWGTVLSTNLNNDNNINSSSSTNSDNH